MPPDKKSKSTVSPTKNPTNNTDAVPGPLRRHRAGERSGHHVVARPVAQQRPDVGLVGGEEAVAELCLVMVKMVAYILDAEKLAVVS